MLTAAFHEAVAPLASPRMGTETMAPLLYHLVRFTCPTVVLEVGMGYTTPFLLKALADNESDLEAGREALARKAPLIASPAEAEDPASYDGHSFAALPKKRRLEWLEAEPSLADPRFYEAGRPPRLIAIDDLSSFHTSAAGASGTLEALGLLPYLDLIDGEFRGKADEIAGRYGRVDFIWFDCGGQREYADFLAEYWPILNPNGGLLLMHYTLTGSSMGRAVEEFRRAQAVLPGAIELVSLLEPHKMMQNSVSIIRKTSDYVDKPYPEVRDLSLERD